MSLKHCRRPQRIFLYLSSRISISASYMRNGLPFVGDIPRINRISLCICEKAAENDAFGSCLRHPFHHNPTRTSGRFNLFLGSSPESLHCRNIHSHPFLRGTYFGSTSSVPKMDSSPSTLRIMARCIYRTVFANWPSPSPPYPSSPSRSA